MSKKKNQLFNGLSVKKTDSTTTDFELRPYMINNYIPVFPSSIVLVGSSGSGKTTLMVFMMKNSDMYNQYYDEIYLVSPTGRRDGLARELHLPDENIVTDSDEMIQKTKEINDISKEDFEANGKNCKKRLVIFDDLTSQRKLQNSKDFVDIFVAGRHSGVSVICMIHKWKALNRTCRQQAHGIFFFACNKSEKTALYDDHSGCHDKKHFFKMMDYCFQPTPEQKKPFMFINTKVDEPIRYRKNFDEVIC